MSIEPLRRSPARPQLPPENLPAPRAAQRLAADRFDSAPRAVPSPGDVWRNVRELVSSLQEVAKTARGQPLDAHQRAELGKVFGDALDVDALRIVEGPAALFDRLPRETPAFTVGNTIVVNPKYAPISDALLVHEATHSWQYQHGGADYLPQALAAQWLGQGYDFERGVADGRSWSQLNPEQQAELVQEAYSAGAFDTPPRAFVKDGVDYSGFVRTAREELEHGRGAAKTWDLSRLWDTLKDRWKDLWR